MGEEEMQNNYIEMLIQDLEKHSFEYWESTQDEMVEALRNLQQKVNQLETNRDEAIDLLKKKTLVVVDIAPSIPTVYKEYLISILERGKE